MITIYDDETLAAARGDITDMMLAELIERIVHDAKASGLWELTCILIAAPCDGRRAFEEVLGFDPLLGLLWDGSGDFIPWWDMMDHHPRFFELLHVPGTEYAYFILLPDAGADRSGLAALCRARQSP